MSTVNVNRVVDASGGVLAPISSVMRNRIINGAMVIDQRNAGAAVTTADAYTLDRWKFTEDTDGAASVQQISDAPAGFNNSARVTVTTADASIGSSQFTLFWQPVEGFNWADLSFGTANAKSTTLSFWVKSSLTGTFSGSLENADGGRSYIFTYTINSANTWEQKTVTIAGDTTGTWVTNNGIGVKVFFTLTAGSSFQGTAGSWGTSRFGATGTTQLMSTVNATWQITGVQLEVGTQATSFEYRQYGTELALCQRYCEAFYQDASTVSPISWQYVSGGMYFIWQFKTEKRAQAAVSKINGTWTGSTPSISGGISTANFSSGSVFYLNSTAGTLNLLATAEL
jgi:hypothetical protein